MGMSAILVMWPRSLTKLSFPDPMEAPHKIWFQSAMQFLRKRNLKMLNLSDLGPRSMNDLDIWYSYMTLTFDIHISSCSHLCFWKIHWFTFFPCKSIRDRIWPWRKISQGQSRVIIWTNLGVPKHPMLHTKFQGHRPFGSGEEAFKVFTIYGHGGHVEP